MCTPWEAEKIHGMVRWCQILLALMFGRGDVKSMGVLDEECLSCGGKAEKRGGGKLVGRSYGMQVDLQKFKTSCGAL